MSSQVSFDDEGDDEADEDADDEDDEDGDGDGDEGMGELLSGDGTVNGDSWCGSGR
ncbi:hypothetical protein ACIQ1S_30945 [Streptomyces griseus]|uniref:hypothetical protein n=1 Tax=Streptomyces griseus TaxID=1911 RepID=UPI0038076A8A